MLSILSGDIQTGKTRWLQQHIDDVRAQGGEVYGVIAPGVWADRRSDPGRYPHADANGFEKLGIDNVLLPDDVRIPFAQRADLAQQQGAFDEKAQSAAARLSWHISDAAIAQVNGHLKKIALLAARHDRPPARPGLLVIDELGRLELLRNGGLTQAMALLEGGPTPLFADALIVVRASLLPHVDGRFEAWGEREIIGL